MKKAKKRLNNENSYNNPICSLFFSFHGIHDDLSAVLSLGTKENK